MSERENLPVNYTWPVKYILKDRYTTSHMTLNITTDADNGLKITDSSDNTYTVLLKKGQTILGNGRYGGVLTECFHCSAVKNPQDAELKFELFMIIPSRGQKFKGENPGFNSLKIIQPGPMVCGEFKSIPEPLTLFQQYGFVSEAKKIYKALIPS